MSTETAGHQAETPGTAGPDRDNRASDCRAVVVVNPQVTKPTGPSRLTNTLFVAHLFATRFRAPQTCEKRRAEPGEANASYRRAGAAPARAGRVVSKKI